MRTEPPPRKRAEQARRTRQQVLDIAIKLFADRGFDGTSLQMIADEMGVTKAAVYYHFRAKADILQALVEPIHNELNELLDAVEAERSRRDRIQTMATGLAEILLGQRALVVVAANDPAVRSHLASEAAKFDAVRERGVRALYGDRPTSDERAALYMSAALGDAIAFLGDLDDDALRATLHRTYVRVLTVR
jgi:AcrR family transcriptional regulator